MTSSGSQLAILACEGCGEPLPIGDADWVLCPACGKRAIVPESYRELRDADRATSAARAQVETFYRQLARRPRIRSWLLRRMGNDRGMQLLVAAYVGYLIALVLAPLAIAWACWWLVAVAPRSNAYQVLAPMQRVAVYALIVYAALVVPALGFWGLGGTRWRRRRQLAAALAAGRPAREGGPATCRACGAPLSVAPGSCAAACLYCHAENLIVAHGALIASTDHKLLKLDDVIAEEQFLRRKARRGLAAALLYPALASLLVMIGVGVFAGEDYTLAEYSGGSLRCSQGTCTEWELLRLDRGHEVRVDLSGTASGPPAVRLEGQAITPFPRSWTTVATAHADDHGIAVLAAPWDGWFRVVVEVPGPADASFRTN
ncbi:MAG: hypothetical protein ACM31C_11405 [Acidobacteriota bacterium]